MNGDFHGHSHQNPRGAPANGNVPQRGSSLTAMTALLSNRTHPSYWFVCEFFIIFLLKKIMKAHLICQVPCISLFFFTVSLSLPTLPALNNGRNKKLRRVCIGGDELAGVWHALPTARAFPKVSSKRPVSRGKLCCVPVGTGPRRRCQLCRARLARPRSRLPGSLPVCPNGRSSYNPDVRCVCCVLHPHGRGLHSTRHE